MFQNYHAVVMMTTIIQQRLSFLFVAEIAHIHGNCAKMTDCFYGITFPHFLYESKLEVQLINYSSA